MKDGAFVRIWDKVFTFTTAAHGTFNARVAITRYVHMVPAMFLIDEHGKSIICSTVNLYPTLPKVGHLFLRSTGICEGLPDQLVAQDIVSPADTYLSNGGPRHVAQEHHMRYMVEKMFNEIVNTHIDTIVNNST